MKRPLAPSNLDELVEDDGNGAWLVTYSDLMTLILVFFILLYTIFFIETERFKDAIATVQVEDQDGKLLSVVEYADRAVERRGAIRLEEATGLRQQRDQTRRELQQIAEQAEWGADVEAVIEDGTLTLRVKGEAVFPSGTADLDGSAYGIFDRIVATLRRYPEYRIAIRGHTDDLPINTPRFSSNWELSAVRATTALRYFLSRGIDPSRMTATGYADMMPLVPNDTAHNRSRNRRVEFVLEKETP